jgi:hypothetical protein
MFDEGVGALRTGPLTNQFRFTLRFFPRVQIFPTCIYLMHETSKLNLADFLAKKVKTKSIQFLTLQGIIKGAMTLSITTLSIMTLSITKLSIMTLSIKTLSITTLSKTVNKHDTQHNDTKHNDLILLC